MVITDVEPVTLTQTVSIVLAEMTKDISSDNYMNIIKIIRS